MDDTLENTLSAAARHLAEGAIDKADQAISAALLSAPTHATALHLRGLILFVTGRVDEAVSYVRQAIAQDSSQGAFFSNLSLMLGSQRRLDESIEAAEQAVALDSSNVASLNQLANAYGARNKFARAHERYEQVYTLAPGHPNALAQGLNCARRIGDFDATARWNERLRQLAQKREVGSHTTWSLEHAINLAYVDVVSPLPLDLSHQLNGRLRELYAQLAPHASRPHRVSDAPRIRIGYLSSKLGDHPIGHVTHQLFKAHDRSKVEVHGFTLVNRDDERSGHAESIKQGCDHFHDLSRLQSAGVADSIRAKGIDILVYLDGLMDPVALSALAFRPAPFQVFWLGHAGTIDLPFIDATVVDDVVLPQGASENSRPLVRLPGCYHCASRQVIEPHVDATLAHVVASSKAKQSPFVFCAFNNPEKIDPLVFDTWMTILRAVPHSLLWLSNQFSVPELEENLRKEAIKRGVAGDRIVFASRVSSKGAHLGRHRQASLFLDTFSLNASTTALDALWAGLPVLTVQGDRFSSRIATDFLTELDMPELICSSVEQYVERAIGFANTPESLSSVRAALATAVWDRDLFKPELFAQKIERALLDSFALVATR